MKKLLLLVCLIPLTTFANVHVERIGKSRDSNFNGITRGINVFQEILREDFNAINEKGLISIEGDFTPKELVAALFNFQEESIQASLNGRANSTILDRGYINDGSDNPRVPEKLQKVIDMYNSQIMGLVRSSSTYKLFIFSISTNDSGENKKGWIILNQLHNEALFGSSDFLLD